MTKGSAAQPHVRAMRLWLLAIAALIAAMVLVGGATRLTVAVVHAQRLTPAADAQRPLPFPPPLAGEGRVGAVPPDRVAAHLGRGAA